MTDCEVRGRVLHGTCGWSDASIVSCGRFYPKSVKTAAEKLSVFSKTFGCVEVDSSCYAIPSPRNVEKWVASVPSTFRFHFKVFGLFCAQSCPTNALPRGVREGLDGSLLAGANVRLSALPEDAVANVWSAFHGAIEPVRKSGQLGSVLFQFHSSFGPTATHRQHVEWCRRRLDARVAMSVEFRSRAWFDTETERQSTTAWLRGLGIALVAADELRHETLQPDRAQHGLPPGQEAELMPIALEVTQPAFFYVRVHRRYGKAERFLAEREHEAWAQRLQAITPQLDGPVYFFWGTDWEDAPVVNAARLQARLPSALVFDWQAHARVTGGGGGQSSIAAMFKGAAGRSAAAPSAAAPQAAAAAHTCGAAATEPLALAAGTPASESVARVDASTGGTPISEGAEAGPATVDAHLQGAECTAVPPAGAHGSSECALAQTNPAAPATENRRTASGECCAHASDKATRAAEHESSKPSPATGQHPSTASAGGCSAPQQQQGAAKRTSTQSGGSAKRPRGGRGGTQLGLLRFFGTGD